MNHHNEKINKLKTYAKKKNTYVFYIYKLSQFKF